jgi:hypothetical protein
MTEQTKTKKGNRNAEASKKRKKYFAQFRDDVVKRFKAGESVAKIDSDLMKKGCKKYFTNYILLREGLKKLSASSKEYAQIAFDTGEPAPAFLGSSKPTTKKSKSKKKAKKASTKQ